MTVHGFLAKIPGGFFKLVNALIPNWRGKKDLIFDGSSQLLASPPHHQQVTRDCFQEQTTLGV